MSNEARLEFPFSTPPHPGAILEVAPGVLWTRLALPFQLNHVNIYLIDDGDGWAVIDTGIDNAATRQAWIDLVRHALGGRRLTRLFASHHHPDHIGLAGWMCQTYDMPLYTTQTAFLTCKNISLSPGAADAAPYREFYTGHGLDETATARVVTQGHGYLKMVSDLPAHFTRIVGGDRLSIGSREFEVITGNGHAPEQAMLYCATDKLLFAADQVIATISPNVSVWSVDAEGDPLGLYLRSLKELWASLPDDVLVLSGHQLPFYGLHNRCSELIAHHEQRCDMIAEACRVAPCSVADLVPVLFHRALDPHQMSFAFSEVLAHVNLMLRARRLRWAEPATSIRRVIAS